MPQNFESSKDETMRKEVEETTKEKIIHSKKERNMASVSKSKWEPKKTKVDEIELEHLEVEEEAVLNGVITTLKRS